RQPGSGLTRATYRPAQIRRLPPECLLPGSSPTSASSTDRLADFPDALPGPGPPHKGRARSFLRHDRFSSLAHQYLITRAVLFPATGVGWVSGPAESPLPPGRCAPTISRPRPPVPGEASMPESTIDSHLLLVAVFGVTGSLLGLFGLLARARTRARWWPVAGAVFAAALGGCAAAAPLLRLPAPGLPPLPAPAGPRAAAGAARLRGGPRRRWPSRGRRCGRPASAASSGSAPPLWRCCATPASRAAWCSPPSPPSPGGGAPTWTPSSKSSTTRTALRSSASTRPASRK